MCLTNERLYVSLYANVCMCLTNVRFEAELIHRESWPRRRIVAHGPHNGQEPCLGGVPWTVSGRSLELLGTLEPAQPEGTEMPPAAKASRRLSFIADWLSLAAG
jgi:hypothetical protein